MAVQTDAMHDRQVVCLTKRQIVNTVSRCRVHDAGAAFRANEVGRKYLERVRRINLKIVEQLLITSTNERAALDGL